MDKGTTTVAAPSGPRIIERPRLTKILDESDARIILLVAPAGYGKTTLARQWLRDKPHVWYRATAASADPVALARGIEAAVFPMPPDARLSSLVRDNPRLPAEPDAIASILLEAVGSAFVEGLVLAIDDFQFIQRDRAAEAVVNAIAETGTVRLLLASRTTPRFIAARNRLYGEAIQLSATDLSFDREEIQRVLRLGAPAPTAGAAPTVFRWPVLATLAATTGTRNAAVGAQPDALYEFFATDVLAEVPAVLEELLEDIALAPSRAHRAQQENLELARHAVSRGLLQAGAHELEMHPLLADFLKKRFRERPDRDERLDRLVKRLFDDEAWDETFALADEFDRADLLADLMEAAAPEYLQQGRIHTVAEWVRAAKRLGFTGAIVDYIEADRLGRLGAHEAALRVATHAADRFDNARLRARSLILAGRSAYLADRPVDARELMIAAFTESSDPFDAREALLGLSRAVTDAEIAPPKLLEEMNSLDLRDPETRVRVATARLMHLTRFGPIPEAVRLGEATERALHALTSPWVRSAFLSVRALVLNLSGDYDGAIASSRRALADVKALRFKLGITQVQIHIACAELGRMRYASADRVARIIEASARQQGDAFLLTLSAILRIRILVAQGLASEALLTPDPPPTTTPSATGELIAVRSFAAAVAGEKGLATELAARARQTTRSIEAHVMAAGAMAIVSPSEKRLRALVMTAQSSGNMDGFLAVTRASREVRDHLMDLVHEDPQHERFVRQAMLEAPHPDEEPTPVPRNLSPRESEVLDLLKQGMTNKQIAKALYISDVTVKVHLRHIYEKLGVRTRVEAALVARDLES